MATELKWTRPAILPRETCKFIGPKHELQEGRCREVTTLWNGCIPRIGNSPLAPSSPPLKRLPLPSPCHFFIRLPRYIGWRPGVSRRVTFSVVADDI